MFVVHDGRLFCQQISFGYELSSQKAALLLNNLNNMNQERIKSIKSHVEAGDYFGTLATIINLLIPDPQTKGEIDSKRLKDIVRDLSYLQENYMIVKK